MRDSLIVTMGGQLERALGTLTALALKWGLDPTQHGVYSGLRLFLDHANRANLGIGPGAVQEIPILRASGRESEADRVADVAFTASVLACLVYASGLLALAGWWARQVDHDPMAAVWSGGLACVAVLVILKRYQDFLIAVHRAHQHFALITELAILDALVFAGLVAVGLWIAGLWGVLGAIGVLILFNIAYLHLRHSMRLGWAWDGSILVRLFRTGLPIVLNGVVYAALLSLDRVLILSVVPDGATAAGLYSIALMGTSWGLDLAGRVASVMYTYFQTTLGRTKEPIEVARQAARVVEAMASPLAAGSAVAYVVAPTFLGLLVPRYAAGLEALRPLLPGMLALGLALPARQAMIAVNRPIRLAVSMAMGLLVAVVAGLIGAHRAGIVGVACGMTLGHASVYLCVSAAAVSEGLGTRGWLAHQGRVLRSVGWYAIGALLAAHLPINGLTDWAAFTLRMIILTVWGLPMLWFWGRNHGWGGLLERRARSALREPRR